MRMWLDLHGAMVAERFEDGEGELLRRIRAIDPRTPICVAYDMHANIFDGDGQQRADRRRLPDLSAHRPAPDRRTRGTRPAARDAGRGDADRRLGQRADAAARHGAGHASGAQQGPAGDVRGVGGERTRAGGQPVRRLPACRCRDGGPVGGGGHRQRSGRRAGDGGRTDQCRLEGAPRVHVRHRAAGGVGAAGQGAGRAGTVAGRAAGSLRQLRQRRHDGHHRHAARDHPAGPGRRGVLRHLRPGCGASRRSRPAWVRLLPYRSVRNCRCRNCRWPARR